MLNETVTIPLNKRLDRLGSRLKTVYKRSETLSRQEEYKLFERMTALREKIEKRKLKKQKQKKSEVQEFEEIRSWLILSNIKLASKWASKAVKFYPSHSQRMVCWQSEAFICLIRSVDRFQYKFGNRFSTYLCRAIYRWVRTAIEKFIKTPYQMIVDTDDTNSCPLIDEKAELSEKQLAARNELQDLMRCLDSRSQYVLSSIWGLGGKKAGFGEIGKELELSATRIRQIHNDALDKLRGRYGCESQKS